MEWVLDQKMNWLDLVWKSIFDIQKKIVEH